MNIPIPKTKTQFVFVYVFCFLLACVILHKNIENLFVDYSLYQTNQQLASFLICEGNHPVINLRICRNYLEKIASWSGVAFAFYYKQYGTEYKRNQIRLSMCDDVKTIQHLFVSTREKSSIVFRHKENKWTEWCEQHAN